LRSLTSGGEKTKRVLLSGIVPAFIAVAVLLGTVCFPPIANAVDPTTTTIYSYGGATIMQLPPSGGNATNPAMTFKFEFWHSSNGTGNFPGPADYLRVWLLVPQINSFNPVAMIVSSQNSSAATAFIRGVVNGTAIARNVIAANSSQFRISNTTSTVIVANLTTPVNIALGSPLPITGNLTIPPMAIEIRGLVGQFTDTMRTTLPSGYNLTSTTTAMPAWVRVWIPSMLGGTYWMTDGTLALQSVDTFVSP